MKTMASTTHSKESSSSRASALSLNSASTKTDSGFSSWHFSRLLVMMLLCISAPVSAAESNDERCRENSKFICGPINAEDLVKIPGTNWVLASRMAGPDDAEGMFYLLNATDYTWRGLEIDSIPDAPDRSAYPDCPGRPTSASFHGQGIAVDERDDNLMLLAVAHGDREAVEIFHIETEDDAEPVLKWVGCVLAPSNAQLNSVAALPGGGFVATRFFDPANKRWAEDLLAGENTGSVLEWSPQTGWNEIEGSEMSGPNGILAAPDGSAYLVAEWGAQKLHRFSPGASPQWQTIDTGVRTDNLQWDSTGQVLVTGQSVNAETFVDCALSNARVCPDPFKVLIVDPGTLAVETVESYPGSTEFGSGTTALDLGSEYWIGTWRGDRIARIAKPAQHQ